MNFSFKSNTYEMIRSDGTFDLEYRYRYSLTRCWDVMGSRMTFIMLNPSTADTYQNDSTITRCMNFARKCGFGSLEVVNLFTYRSTDPRLLSIVDDPVGPDNNTYMLNAIR